MRHITLAATCVLAAVAFTGCGNGSPPETTPASKDHNAADVTFAQAMIPHHQQAVEMANLVPTRAENPQIKALATQIQGAQEPEIKQMTAWLQVWGEPTAAPGEHDPMGHNGPGMMSKADIENLAGLSGKAFDREFLTMMTEHHEGAVEMARTEQKQGRFGPAKTLAASIIKSQTAEITFMADLLEQP